MCAKGLHKLFVVNLRATLRHLSQRSCISGLRSHSKKRKQRPNSVFGFQVRFDTQHPTAFLETTNFDLFLREYKDFSHRV